MAVCVTPDSLGADVLLLTFRHTLETLLEQNKRLDPQKRRRYAALLAEVEAFAKIDADDYTDEDDARMTTLCNRLIETINEFAATGTYFGAHTDDEWCFGFWPLTTTTGEHNDE